MNIQPISTIQRQAETAAETDAGPQANPYPGDSTAFAEWNRIYYNQIQMLAVECAS